MKKIFLKLCSLKVWQAVLLGVAAAIGISFILAGIINLVFYYYI